MVRQLRKASSMIELVIAIVVMGIAVMTLPLMLERTQANNAFAMQQEAILAAKTHIGDIITFPWDENTLNTTTNVVAVLDTDSPNYNRFPDANSTRRVGHVLQDKRRKFFTNETNASDIGAAATNNIIDIGDFDDTNSTLNQATTAIENAGILDYRYDFNMTTKVRYITDTPAPTFVFLTDGNKTVTSNIKMIEVKLQGDGISTFSLRAYSSNIGESKLLRRDY